MKIIRSTNIITDESELGLNIREMKIPLPRLIPDEEKSLVVSGVNRKRSVSVNFFLSSSYYLDIALPLDVCVLFFYLQRRLLIISILFQKFLLKIENLIKNTVFLFGVVRTDTKYLK